MSSRLPALILIAAPFSSRLSRHTGASNPERHYRFCSRYEEQSMPQTFQGGCHCGRVRFRVKSDLARIVDCNCSICSKKGFLHLIVAPEQFELLSGQDELITYEFNTKTAKHTFCRTCGIHPFYVPRSHPDMIDVNVRCLDGVDLAAIHPEPFDGQNWEVARRSYESPSPKT